MFYMGGMTLGYFSPHPAEACGTEPGEVSFAAAAKPARKGLLDFLKPAAEQDKPSRQPQAWPIHVFY